MTIYIYNPEKYKILTAQSARAAEYVDCISRRVRRSSECTDSGALGNVAYLFIVITSRSTGSVVVARVRSVGQIELFNYLL